MDIYDLMYSKEALYIYIFLFSNKNLDKTKEHKIKDMIYAIYMYSYFYEKTKTLEKFYQILQEVNDIEDIDNLLAKDENLNKIYKLFPIHEEIIQEITKNEYKLFLTELKQQVLDTNINDILYFIEIKNNIDRIYEKIYEGTISQQELSILNNTVENQLKYLEKYLPCNDIEAYRTYFKIKYNKYTNNTFDIETKLFELKKGKIKFSELKQFEELKNRTQSAKYMKMDKLDNMELNKEEIKQIRIYALTKILRDAVFLIISYFLIGRFGIECYKNFIETDNNYMLMPFIIWIIIVLLLILNILNYTFIAFRKYNSIKGAIGFVGNISWNQGKTSKKIYNIFFPKYNSKYDIYANYSTKKLQRKSMVKFVKISTKRIVIPIKDKTRMI